MFHDQSLPADTAPILDSVWRYLPRDDFRKNLVALQRVSNEVPGDPAVHLRNNWSEPRIRYDDQNYVLPFSIEQRLADDFAFLAAAEEGVKAVSAVGLEQDVEHHGMTIRLAANDTIPPDVPKIFSIMFDLLVKCAGKTLSRNLCSESLFNLVISLSRERIHGRLQSVHWKVPNHLRGATREPLHQELRKIAARLEQQRRQMPADSKKLIQSLYELCDYYQQINSCKKHTNEELQLLKDAIRHSHALATSNGKCTIEETVSNHGLDSREICSNKVIKQLNKIGRYWGLCIDMAEASRKYGEIFKNLELKTLPPYQAIRSSISFVKGKIARCHVHAEIQLLTFYDLNLNLATAKPRVLGVSKSACYLCNMFILKHGQFFITKTHGRLYDQWNVPDLVEFGQAQRNAFRQVLSSMNRDIQTNLIRGRRSVHRDFPLGSYVNLPENIPQSVVHSSAATLEPVELPGIVRHVESEARPPQAQSTPSAPQPTRHIGSSVTPIPLTTLPKSIESSPHRPAMSPISGPTDQPSETTFAITNSASTALSSTSIISWEIPIQRTLTSKSSFWISDERLSAQIEFDGPGQGQVTVSGVTKTTTGLPKNPIDLSRLVPNETMQLRRAEADDSLVLGLNHGQCIMEITFHWLS